MTTHNPTQASARIEAAEAEIREQLGRLVAAVEARDLGSITRVYAADVVSFDIDPPLQHVGLEAKLANWRRAFTLFREVSYELRDVTLAVDENVAFGYGFGRLSGTRADRTTTNGMWVRATYGLRRLGGEWLVVHDQVSVPFDVRNGRGVADLEP